MYDTKVDLKLSRKRQRTGESGVGKIGKMGCGVEYAKCTLYTRIKMTLWYSATHNEYTQWRVSLKDTEQERLQS